MKTLIDKINHFESTTGTVAEFNNIFAVKLEGVCPSLEVEIGELADSDTTRILTVGKLIVKHNFSPNKVTEVDEDGENIQANSRGGFYRESKVNKWSR